MIVSEIVTFRKRKFKRTYSDEGFIIQKVGTNDKYSEAVDVLDSEYEYIETDEADEAEYQKIKAELVAEENNYE